ncbi:DUF1127 domain-containing protein [Mesorhizobium sp. CO1-1-7]|jgi:uncharacterized protein YjiS (DUF1127 family)|uniref:Putative conserved small protein n=1 Tax=Mesorhizobium australicum (strain HAMBI 3006 / LMG 24608 / WSM2073) TaxID=754035 RepID=L0KDZ2_MESAW|nr:MULTISPECIES: DUF1127 domain-containing protein [Mesorhizobium]MBZ9929925.1 DUF1127 domain-containing protein [Mesorhizobium sp. BR1-1-5]AGB43226.1 putative conserved small protein [Mesorhizobium australicum WSM2073]MBZ9684487.1 DUF1127 domain-containing protein [Mesorhizobium sp. CO1-1-2]MBZ9748954.1 DUF1127 domain-containing protein [Mesorhizobium sp. CO1-1-7]MBZ9909752.1 DUF1127 domain-containing protein [Mesorhizobium sp. BR115XR7A]
MNNTIASVQHRAVRPGVPVQRSSHPRSLRSMVASWRERTRFRWDLKRMSEVSPHLIDDIGLTQLQAKAEIAKLPFWQR